MQRSRRAHIEQGLGCGHLSASGTIITPVTAFAAAFSSISLFDDSVAYTQAVNQRSN